MGKEAPTTTLAVPAEHAERFRDSLSKTLGADGEMLATRTELKERRRRARLVVEWIRLLDQIGWDGPVAALEVSMPEEAFEAFAAEWISIETEAISDDVAESPAGIAAARARIDWIEWLGCVRERNLTCAEAA